LESPESVIETTRDRLTLLITLNVFQPVIQDELNSSLSKLMKGKKSCGQEGMPMREVI
jgi:hypothetical protein